MNIGTTLGLSHFTRVGCMPIASPPNRLPAFVAVAAVSVLGLNAIAGAATAPTTTRRRSTATTTLKRRTPTTIKKRSTTIVDTAVVAPTTALTKPVASGAPTTSKPAGATTTVATKTVKGTVFIPGAGRVLDLGAAEVAKLAAGGRVEADVRGASGLAASGTGTVIVDVTVANPTTPGKVVLTPVAPDFARAVVSSSVAFVAGSTTVSRIAVPVGAGGLVKIATSAGPSGLAVAVVGWVVPAPQGTSEASAIALETCRVLDTVSGLGGLQGEVTPARPFDLPAVGIAKVPPALGAAVAPTGVILSVGASQANGPLDINVVPTGAQSPTLTLSMAPVQSTAGLFIVPVGADARAAFYVSAGGAQLTVDAIAWLDKDGVAHSGGPC